MPNAAVTATADAATRSGRPPKGQGPDLRAFAVERLLAGLAQAREAVRSLSVPVDHPAQSVHLALAADVTQAESTARVLRRALEAP